MLTLDNFHQYQWDGLAHCHLNRYSGLYYDAGLGKTAIGLTYLVQRLKHLSVSRRALVIAPIRVACQTWPNELAEWQHLAGTPYQLVRAEDDDPEVKAFHRDTYQRARQGGLQPDEVDTYVGLCRASLERQWEDFWTAGLSPIFAQPQDLAEFDRLAAYYARLARTDGLPPEEATRAAGTITTGFKDRLRRAQLRVDVPLHFINREALPWLVDVLKEERRGCPYDDAIYDEASDLGDHNTQRFKAMRELRRELKSFIQMTATPAAEGYQKLFSQRWLMDTGDLWGNAITHWRDEHFTYNSKTYSYKLRKGHDKIISSQMADICLVAKAEDHLPEVATGWADLTRKIELGPELRELEKEFIESRILRLSDSYDDTGIPDDFIDADNPASLSQKLLQFCSGAVYDDKKKARAIHDHKIEELRQLIDELQGEPIMLVYWWQSSLARLKKAFPKMAVMDRKGSQQDGWNKGKYQLLAVHPQGSEFGLNLQKGPGHDIAIFDMFWSYEKWYQIHKRLARQGQTRPVRSWPLVVKGSADEVAVKRLQAKEDAQNALFRYIMDMRAEITGQRVERKEPSYAEAFD
ncbi:MAG: hypothetical protein CMG88_03780 [Marinobacter sp.]|nr:hypothetical protein [Marinobacter sp.]MBP53665.1 hypothetical protein [Marinobacter sp.]|tara:strand:+ start:2344 stop:4077 length:1734 start_codon:yes stop_codon:yes gene_type:complete